MSWIAAKLYDRALAAVEAGGLRAWRAELLAPLKGDVIEIGAGTGLNLAHYPPTVDRLVVAEPDRHMRSRIDLTAATGPGTVELLDAADTDLPFPDDSFDAAVTTLVLCTVPDPTATLTELQRVLRPGGQLVYLEHVSAIDRPNRLKWQRRLEPAWKRVSGGCHLTRDTEATITATGFELEEAYRESMRKAAPVVRPSVRGRARNPAPATPSPQSPGPGSPQRSVTPVAQGSSRTSG